MVDENKINEVAKTYLDTQIINAGANPRNVYEFISALQKVSGLSSIIGPPSITLNCCKKFGILEKWVNRHFSEKCTNIRVYASFDSKQYDGYSIVEHIRKESGLDFIGIKVSELGVLLTYDLGCESYASLSLRPYKVDIEEFNRYFKKVDSYFKKFDSYLIKNVDKEV